MEEEEKAGEGPSDAPRTLRAKNLGNLEMPRPGNCQVMLYCLHNQAAPDTKTPRHVLAKLDRLQSFSTRNSYKTDT